MPIRDGTGPMSLGPLTGRGFGPCRRGLGWGRGFGRFFGWNIPTTQVDQKQALADYRKALEEELEEVKKEELGLK